MSKDIIVPLCVGKNNPPTDPSGLKAMAHHIIKNHALDLFTAEEAELIDNYAGAKIHPTDISWLVATHAPRDVERLIQAAKNNEKDAQVSGVKHADDLIADRLEKLDEKDPSKLQYLAYQQLALRRHSPKITDWVTGHLAANFSDPLASFQQNLVARRISDADASLKK